MGGMKANAHGTLGWRHAFDDATPTSRQAFASSDAFTVAGVPIARDTALIEAGLDVDLTKSATLGVAYQGQFGDGAMQNGFKANLDWKFYLQSPLHRSTVCRCWSGLLRLWSERPFSLF
ncbi:autotransporter domain-containing protein [Ochrobactrum daejeonense]|nr:autotransporter domain-containing protein [Brucella daejeonensis]